MRIGIRREDKNEWEKRVPLTPAAVGALVADGIDVVIQPSDIRIYPDAEYTAAGATVQEDLSDCPLVFAVKEIPQELFQPDTAYVFFSHTIKGQEANLPMLKRLMDLKCHLFDYERVADEQGRRLIFFGRFAGVAGMIDTFWALGRRFEWERRPNPFVEVKPAHAYGSTAAAKAHISQLAKNVTAAGLPRPVAPLVVGFAGYGNVSQGAQEIFDLWPHEEIKPEELASRWEEISGRTDRLFKVVFKEEHLVEPREAGATFELQDYYDHPEKYRGRFEGYLDDLSVLVNCIYWEPRYPRLVTCDEVRQRYTGPERPRLRVIGDISCDIEGSIECTVAATDPGQPVYVYIPTTEEVRLGWEGHGPVIMAVDNLPCELASDASETFSEFLLPFVPRLVQADYSAEFAALNVPAEFKRAMILHGGELTGPYTYMRDFL
jgi:alpha-aminoadipic semialdehyde synthase